jgi:hypothetical protein
MSTVIEIEDAIKQLPLQDARAVALWLQKHLEQERARQAVTPSGGPVQLPDYAARRRRIFGDKVLPNIVLLGRDQERW